jgi:hypothetical protein
VLKGGGLIHRAIRYEPGIRHPVSLARLVRMLRRQHAETLVYLAPEQGLGCDSPGRSRSSSCCRFFGESSAPSVTKGPAVSARRRAGRASNGRASVWAVRWPPSGRSDFSDRSWWTCG